LDKVKEISINEYEHPHINKGIIESLKDYKNSEEY
jgi:hypothetical protein